MANPSKSLVSSAPSPGAVVAGVYDSTPPAPADGQAVALQTDSQGNLLVNVKVGSATNPSVGVTGSTAPTSATEIGIVDNSGNLQNVSSTNPVPENLIQWGSTTISPASNISGDGTQVGPVIRPIQRKYTQTLTTTLLGSNAAFTSPWFDTNQSGAALVAIMWRADQIASSTPLPTIQGSNDTTNANFTISLAVFSGSPGGAATWQMYAIVPTRYWRFVYTNGATAQGSFEVVATEMDIPPGFMFGANNGGTPGNGFNTLTPAVWQISSFGAGSVSMAANGSGATADNIRADAILANTAFRPLGAAQMVLQSAAGTQTWIEQRTPSTFKTAKATATGTTAVWTPTSGKKFRLMRFKIMITADAHQTSGGEVDFDLQDSSTSINVIHTVFIPTAAGTTLAGWYDSGWVDLGNGILSTTANNVLNLVFTATGFVGAVRVITVGTEE